VFIDDKVTGFSIFFLHLKRWLYSGTKLRWRVRNRRWHSDMISDAPGGANTNRDRRSDEFVL
jgi:hypothetical protein